MKIVSMTDFCVLFSAKTHKDSSYTHTEPQSLYGFWFALDDATPENSCLWFQPGSHINSNVDFRLVRNLDPAAIDGQLCTTRGKELDIEHEETNFVPAPVSRVLFHLYCLRFNS